MTYKLVSFTIAIILSTIHCSANQSINQVVLFFYDSTDIDECIELLSNCSQLCIDTPGSYVCDCNLGYTLDSDGVSCTGKIRYLRLLLILHTYMFTYMCLFIVALFPGGGRMG